MSQRRAIRVLDTIADIGTLLALAIAGVGQFLPWVHTVTTRQAGSGSAGPPTMESVTDFQMWHATHSGTALAVAAVLICFSLVFSPGGLVRKVLVFLMFAAVFTAICFQAMVFTPMPITAAHAAFAETRLTSGPGFYVALVPTIIAGMLCLVRMIWTMSGPSKTLPLAELVSRDPRPTDQA
jgi:hypothetical protein